MPGKVSKASKKDKIVSEFHQKVADQQTRGEHGRFVKKVVEVDSKLGGKADLVNTPLLGKAEGPSQRGESKGNIPPLVSFEVSNPVTYLKLWWSRVMNNEGIDFRFRIRPLTAMALMSVFAVGGFGLGRLSIPGPEQIIKYAPQWAPTPTPDPWKETAYFGGLQKTGERFYLLTEQAEAISLMVPTNVSLTKYIGKRILAVGKFNRLTGVLQVMEAADLEVLIQSAPVPTAVPSATPTVTKGGEGISE